MPLCAAPCRCSQSWSCKYTLLPTFGSVFEPAGRGLRATLRVAKPSQPKAARESLRARHSFQLALGRERSLPDCTMDRLGSAVWRPLQRFVRQLAASPCVTLVIDHYLHEHSRFSMADTARRIWCVREDVHVAPQHMSAGAEEGLQPDGAIDVMAIKDTANCFGR